MKFPLILDIYLKCKEKKIINFNKFKKIIKKLLLFNKIRIFGDWGLGIGDWGLGIGDWAQSPIPNPHLICSN